VTTQRSDFAEILRSLRSHGRACKCKKCVLNTSLNYCSKRFQYGGEDMRFIFERIGYSAKMNEIEAAVGLGNLGMYKKILEKRRKNLYFLIEQFKNFSKYFFTLKKEKYEEIGPHAFPIVLKKEIQFTRNQLVAYLNKNNIDTRNLFLSMPTQCPGFEFLGYKKGSFPNAEYIGQRGLHIGVHQDLNKEHLQYIGEIFNRFCNAKIKQK